MSTTARDQWKQVQAILGTAQDGIPGQKDETALNALKAAARQNLVMSSAPGQLSRPSSVNHVMASSFADPADVARFRRCKADGGSDQNCFKVGDNGIGKWGDDTTADTPMVALPPEDWQQFGAQARGKRVLVTANNRQVVAELRDTMPHRANIRNGAGIDLNPAACKALGLTPPIMAKATWSWA